MTIPVRAITKGPERHWFGYYDKFQFDATDRYVLGMEVDFEGRDPTSDDVIRIGMVDTHDGDRWIDLGESRAWCWQQGCMLQWRPGHDNEVVWNDLGSGRFVSHVVNVETGVRRTLPMAIYTMSPDGKTAVSPDLRRIQDMRPGYGYPGVPDPNADVLAPEDAGIWRMDIETGKHELIISIADVAKIPWPGGDLSEEKHYFNHLLWGPDGSRFIFLNRGGPKFVTRLMTAAPDGSDIRQVDDYGGASHFIWRDPQHILVWSYNHPSDKAGFWLYGDGDGSEELIGEGVMTENGHCSYLPDTDWIINDTYASAKNPDQELFLYHVPTGRKVQLGPFETKVGHHGGGERCDLHPRVSRDGRSIVIDSTHGDEGRQLYLLDISSIVG